MAPSTTPRTGVRLDVDERREQLLQVGTDLFSHRPFDEVSIDDIAAAARISKGLLYHYFPTKRDFYIGAVRHAADELRGLVEQDPMLPESEQLARGLSAYFEYVENRAEGYVTLMRSGIGSDPDVRAIVDDVRDYVVRLIVRALGVKGDPRPVVGYAIRGWFGFLEQTSLDWLGGRPIDREELLQLPMGALAAILRAAAELDPDAGVDPALMADVLAES